MFHLKRFFLPKIQKIRVFLFGKFQTSTPPRVFSSNKNHTPRFQALRGHLEVSTVAPPDPCVTDVTSGGHWSAPQIVKKYRHGRAVGPGEDTGCFSRWWKLSNMCYFHPYLGTWSNLTIIFFKWVGSTTNLKKVPKFCRDPYLAYALKTRCKSWIHKLHW